MSTMRALIVTILSWVALTQGLSVERQTTASCNTACRTSRNLSPLLSKRANITNASTAPRWSTFDMQNPGVVVNVATENDVLVTVQYCNANGLSFFAQAGGNAWADTFHVTQKDVTINLRGINAISFTPDKTQITFQGGAIIQEVVNAAYAIGARVPTGNCNCVGTLGAILGGGVGRLMGLYGFGVDNLLHMNVVTAAGVAITVSPTQNPDLWWALRGAGANFGIVTSATMKSYPVPTAQNGAWTGDLIYTDDKIEAIVQTINNLDLQPPMAVFLYYAYAGAPTVIVVPYYIGTTAQGKAAFASLYALGPIADTTVWTPYNETNDGSNSFCMKGDRKPAFGAGLGQLVPATWRAVWNAYVAFTQYPGTQNSAVLVECYSLHTARMIPASSASYPFRNTVNFQAAVIPWYSNASFDQTALAFASNVRSLWRSTDGLAMDSTYINFAFNDTLPTVYGNSLPRLEALKQQYDPMGRFDQFFPID